MRGPCKRLGPLSCRPIIGRRGEAGGEDSAPCELHPMNRASPDTPLFVRARPCSSGEASKGCPHPLPRPTNGHCELVCYFRCRALRML